MALPIISATANAATGIVPLWTLGSKMEELEQRAIRVVSIAREAGSHTLMEGAERAEMLISSLKVAYADSLDKTVEKVSQVVRNRFAEADSSLKDLEATISSKFSFYLDQGQVIAATMPLADNRPQLISTSPACIAPSEAGHIIRLRVRGHFFDGGQADSKPSLLLNQGTYEPKEVALTALTFEVPADQILASAELSQAVGKLSVPFQGNPYCFPISIGILPETPGSIVIDHEKPVIEREQRSKIGPLETMDSTSRGARRNLQHIARLDATLGEIPEWKVVPGTAQVTTTVPPDEKKKGNAHLQPPQIYEKYVTCEARTVYVSSGNQQRSGQLRFRIRFDEYRYVQKGVVWERTLPQRLEWGQSRIFSYPIGKWKITFTPSNGSSPREFNSAAMDHPFLKITTTGEQFTVITRDPADVRLYSVVAPILMSPKASPELAKQQAKL